MVRARVCIEAGDDPRHLKRPAPHPGPRCDTCHREVVKERKVKAHDAYSARTYGAPRGFYARMVKYQGGKCAICQRATGKRKRLANDHQHDGGVLRGALCGPCNQFVGRCGDDPEVFLRGYWYLINPPAVELARTMGLPPIIVPVS
jgi:Recombination endonuclease VII